VARLTEERRYDDAERWAAEGIARGDHYGGHRLCKLLCELARKRRDWPRVEAFEAEEFFEHSSVERFAALMKAAGKASCEPAVRAAALHFLQTGERPTATAPPAPTEGGTRSRRDREACAT
jgi:uncharacterized Zn finger protein